MGSCSTSARVRPFVPAEHGEVAWDWGDEGLLELAWRNARALGSGPLARLRRSAREELGLPLEGPIVASGHQPFPVHPGVAIREMLLDRLPEEVFPLWIVVDSDAPAEVAVRVPLLRRRHTHHCLILLENHVRHVLGALEVPAEITAAWPPLERRIRTLHNREILKQAQSLWEGLPRAEGTWSEWVRSVRSAWGGVSERVRCVSVLELVHTEAYREFVWELLRDRNSFLEAYDSACRLAGVRPLAAGQLPFWTLDQGRRIPAGEGDVPLVPRALMLTLAVRALLCDFFLHGAGGAGYEPGVDRLWQSMWDRKPPLWGWMSGTFKLPEPSERMRALPERDYPFFLYNPEEVVAALQRPLAAL
ncbi:MAG: hypothetical protein R6U88_06845 [Candidatus Bipolaricaulota bacterium]